MARFERSEVIDINELYKLEDLADAGSEDAAQKLRELSRVYSKRASERMRTLEKSGMDTAALQRAQYYLDDRGRSRFGTGKNAALEDVVENLEQARKFLVSKTSTVGGERARINQMLDTMQSGPHPVIDKFKNQKDRQEFLNFLASDAFADLKKYIGTNLSEAQQAIESGRKVSELVKIYQNYVNKTVDNPILVWEEWTVNTEE